MALPPHYACVVTESSSTDSAAAATGNGVPSAAGKRELDLAFEELYRDHLRDVYSYCYYRIGNHHDAEDLTEQTFLQAYRHFERARRESDGRPLRRLDRAERIGEQALEVFGLEPWLTHRSPPRAAAPLRAA